jgi:hypothetical protein
MNATTEFNIEALPVIVTYVACVPSKWGDEQKTMVDQWRIVIETKSGYWSTDYWTGLGLRETIRGARAMVMPENRFVKGKWQATKPVKPKIADVMYSLFMDASAADENFHDWCENFGYSSDSIKAMNTYKQCLEIAVALRKHFDPATRAAIQSVIEEM